MLFPPVQNNINKPYPNTYSQQMAIKLWGSKTPGNAENSRDLNLLKNKKKVIKMLLIVVILFCLAWFPLQLYNVLNVTWPSINEYRHINIIFLCCDWLAMSNSCYNPFIYGIYNVSRSTKLILFPVNYTFLYESIIVSTQ